MKSKYDVVIIGAGHNGLVAAAYLAKAGKSVLLLEKAEHYGGAAVSERVFPDFDVKVSKYSYLVSLFPQKIFKDLGIKPILKQRTYASYTPAGNGPGLLISNRSDKLNKENFKKFTGNLHDYNGWQKILRYQAIFAAKVWPGLIQPLVSCAELKSRFKTKEEKLAWEYLCEKPLASLIEDHIDDDYIRGLLFTDGKIGVSSYPEDRSLLQNRTFIYHIIGNGTGEWRVPLGGMGGITDSLFQVATKAGAKLLTSVNVKSIKNAGEEYKIRFAQKKKVNEVTATYVLVNAAPHVLKKLRPEYNLYVNKHDEGSVFKINMLLKKAPKLKNGVTFAQAFTGTFHIDESYEQMNLNIKIAKRGKIGEKLSGEMYCQSLTDPSVVSPALQKKGYHTLTLFGLDMPYSLFVKNNEAQKKIVLKKFLAGINQFLETPIEECLAVDKKGQLCLQAKSPVDLEREVGLPLGNIFHNQLSWPYAETKAQVGTWGVETNLKNIFLCGAGAMRGGCVSGIPGHNAAMKILAM